MRLAKPVDIRQITQALAKGGCPICVFLKNYQSASLQGAAPDVVAGVCNFHAWALAAAVKADHAASLFLNLLARLDEDASGKAARECSFCAQIRQQETLRLKELAQQLRHPMVMRWMEKHGRLCRAHASKLLPQVPVRLQPAIRAIARRSAQELQEELQSFLTRVREGQPGGGGVLGRAAEFLVSQRGVETE
ncbi:MAG TPA: hypothetical protein VNK82_00075 [Terriglobales bacterium]|nr:hypothetical protein [Terriglobales bacterium]